MTTIDQSVTIGPRQRRRDARVAQILDEAWVLARRDGLAAVSLRELAAAVGLRQPSLYVYFDSKHALYDAMFADGNRQLFERVAALDPGHDPRTALKAFMRELTEFALENEARHQLLF